MAARILDDRPPLGEGPLRAAIRRAHRADEAATIRVLLAEASVEPESQARIQARARRLAERVREAGGDQLGVEAFLHEYSLSTREGIMLMCLAEALLRIPDAETRDRLIRDKLGFGDWARHLGQSESLFVNASTWGLMLTGRLVRVDMERDGEAGTRFTPPGPAARRAGGAPGDPAGDARARAPFRARPDDRDGDPARARARAEGLPLLLRHAGRRRADHRRRRALSAGLSGRDRGDRQSRARRRPDRRGPASRSSSRRCIRATSWPSTRRLEAELLPRLIELADAGARGPHHAHHRRRGGRPAGALARSVRAPGARRRARRLERPRARGAGLSEARAST